MALRSLAVLALLLGLQASPAGAQLRFEGLERLYFERVDKPFDLPAQNKTIAQLLRQSIPVPPDLAPGTGQPQGSFEDLRVRDFALSSPASPRRLWLREVLDTSHPRMATLWWALYDEGRRTDLWTFHPTMGGVDKKSLTNYELHTVLSPGEWVLGFQVLGTMFRPGGAWWIVGKQWTFVRSQTSLTLTEVCNVFGLFRGYDSGEAPNPISVTTEQRIPGGYRIRKVDAVMDSALAACGFHDPYFASTDKLTWESLSAVARCITGRDDAKESVRKLGTRSFIERPGD